MRSLLRKLLKKEPSLHPVLTLIAPRLGVPNNRTYGKANSQGRQDTALISTEKKIADSNMPSKHLHGKTHVDESSEAVGAGRQHLIAAASKRRDGILLFYGKPPPRILAHPSQNIFSINLVKERLQESSGVKDSGYTEPWLRAHHDA